MNKKRLFTIILCTFIAAIATFLASLQGFMGAPMIGLILSILLVNLCESKVGYFKDESSWVGKKFLNLGVVITGGTLNFMNIAGIGLKAMPLLITNILIAFLVASYVGRKLDCSHKTSLLVGGGTAICGGTAISSIASVVDAEDKDIAYAMSAIFIYDLFGAIIYPYLPTYLGLSADQFGFLAGASINDMSSVVAAEATYNVLHQTNSEVAITVKLARTTLLIFVVLFFAIAKHRQDSQLQQMNGEIKSGQPKQNILSTVFNIFPKFIIAFLLMACLNTFFLADHAPELVGFFKQFSKLIITIALSAVGFKIRFRELLSEGKAPLMIGGITWLFVALTSFAFIQFFV